MDAAALASLWLGVAAPIARDAKVPPPAPTPAVLAEVARGKVGRVSLPGKGLAAYGVLPLSRALAWLTLTDDHLDDDVDALTEVLLAGRWTTPKVIYQRIDLPWPFADRHYVLVAENNAALAAAGVWERAWHVDNSWLAPARARTDAAAFDAAATLPENRGNWLLVPVDETHTLAISQAWTDLGGAIPADAAQGWARASVDDLYASLVKHSVAVAERCAVECAATGPDGSALSAK